MPLEPAPKKKMLFVDDRTKRLMYALNEYGKIYDVTIAACVPEALRFLSKFDWDIVSLDHDLHGHDFQEPDTPGCGMKIVEYLIKCGGWPEIKEKPVFWIHSTNLFASHKMIVALKGINLNAYHLPISENVKYIQYDERGIPK